jgi:hypothetical protein
VIAFFIFMNTLKRLTIISFLIAGFVFSADASAANGAPSCATFLTGTPAGSAKGSLTFDGRTEAARLAPARKESRDNTSKGGAKSKFRFESEDEESGEPEFDSTRRRARSQTPAANPRRIDAGFQGLQMAVLPDLSPLRTVSHRIANFEGDVFFPNENAYRPSYIHRLELSAHSIDLVIPKDANLDWATNGIIKTLSELPLARIEALRIVRLNARDSQQDAHWQKTYKDFKQAAAAAGDGQIDIFSGSIEIFARANAESIRMTRHEFGHLVASLLSGSIEPPPKYIRRAERDRTDVSDYGNNNWAEDFAEGIEAYLRTNAGRLDLRLRADLQKRFTFFDDVFNERSPQSANESANEHLGVFVRMLDRSHILAIAPDIGTGILLDLN